MKKHDAIRLAKFALRSLTADQMREAIHTCLNRTDAHFGDIDTISTDATGILDKLEWDYSVAEQLDRIERTIQRIQTPLGRKLL